MMAQPFAGAWTRLPLRRYPRVASILSPLIVLLLAGMSLAGLFAPHSLYPSEALRRALLANDAVNLFLGIPALLGAQVSARCGRWSGLLFWPGALFYVVYNAIAYALAVPVGWPTAGYLGLLVLSLWALCDLLAGLDAPAVAGRLQGAAPELLAGGALLGLGALFLLRGLAQGFGWLAGQATLSQPELGVLAADLLTTPAWVVGGALLWRRRASGYAWGGGLLFQAGLLFAGLLLVFLLQPFLAGQPFPALDFGVVLGMSLICFIPLGVFWRCVENRAIR